MDDLLARAPSPLDAALGLRVVEAGDDGDLLRLEPSAIALGGSEPRPFLHGGTLAACVDTAGWAAVHHVAPGDWLAIDLRCDFLRLAGTEPLRVSARPLRVGRTLAVADVLIAPWDEPARPVAAGRVQLLRTGP